MTGITRRTRYALGLAAVTASLAVAASPAMAIDAPSVSGTGSAYSFSRSFTFSAAPDPGYTIIGYQGAVDEPAPTASVTSGQTFGGLSVGPHTFRVRAIQQDLLGVTTVESAYAELPFDVLADTTPPVLGAVLQGTPTAAGWYNALSIGREPCADAESGLPAGACAATAWTQNGVFAAGAQSVQVTDLQGNTATAPVPAFNFDNVQPVLGEGVPLTPSSGAIVPEEPTFQWSPGQDLTSGVAEYELQIRIADPENDTPPITTIARVTDTGGVGNYSTARQPAVSPDAMPEGKKIEWRVRTIDRAGNVRTSDWWAIRIDSTIPPAPSITAGPEGPTRDTSPTFRWDGTQQTYKWDVRRAGAETPVREGAGPATQATLSSLPDGDYIFRVTQVTEAGRGSAEATRTFQVDTTPPEPPTILSRPTFPAITAPVFTWSAEPGAYSRWVVIGSSGGAIVGPVDTPVTSAELPQLADGAYSFQVQQVDAAGNVSAATGEPFTVLAPLAPAPAPGGSSGTIAALALPTQNAARLQPKAGKVVPTLAPVLKWTKGPRGTKLYNLQIFRVTAVKKGAAPKVTKIFSAFPKGLQARAPKTKLKAGTCYVWRVWPYTGQAFTPKPVGVSNFCTASAKVITLKAKQAKARAAKAKAAKLRAARLKR
jgi:hypothetical protein